MANKTIMNKLIAVNGAQKELLIELVQEELLNIEKGFDISLDKGRWRNASEQLNAIGPRKSITDWKKCWLDIRLMLKKQNESQSNKNIFSENTSDNNPKGGESTLSESISNLCSAEESVDKLKKNNDCIICLESAKKFLKHQLIHLHTNQSISSAKSNTISISEAGCDYEISVKLITPKLLEENEDDEVISTDSDTESNIAENTESLIEIKKEPSVITKSKRPIITYLCDATGCGKGFLSKYGLKRHQDFKHKNKEEL